jgi:hypothetical protein
MNNLNYMYNFICVFVFTLCVTEYKKMQITTKAWELLFLAHFYKNELVM